MKRLPHYHTNMNPPIKDLLEFFSINFSGPTVGATEGKNKYIPIFEDHFMNRPIASIIDNVTSAEVIRYVEKDFIDPFGPPNTIVSDNAVCFTSSALKKFKGGLSIYWKKVPAYAPMSNRKA